MTPSSCRVRLVQLAWCPLRWDNGGVIETNVELARRGFEAALRGNLDAVRELLDKDVKWHGGDPSAPGACHNREQALEFMRQARSGRRVGELVDVVDAGDKVVVIMRPPAQGGEHATLSANLTTFRDGKVIEMVHYPNPDDALAAADV
jgi:ketosteroid isomerase-like protein